MAVLTNASGRPMDKWTPADWDQFMLERIRRYGGNSYLVGELVDTGEYTREAARREVADPATLLRYLEYDLLPQILADRTACLALKDALLEPNPELIQALADAAKRLRVPRKRGPKGKMAGGQYLYQRIIAVRDQKGLSWREIALRVFKDRTKGGLVKAHYYVARKRLLAGKAR